MDVWETQDPSIELRNVAFKVENQLCAMRRPSPRPTFLSLISAGMFKREEQGGPQPMSVPAEAAFPLSAFHEPCVALRALINHHTMKYRGGGMGVLVYHFASLVHEFHLAG